MKSNFIWSLEDCITYYAESWDTELDIGQPITKESKPYVAWLMAQILGDGGSIFASGSPILAEQVNKLFCTYLAPVYKTFNIVIADEDSLEDMYQEWARTFVYVVNTTYPKYSKLIEIYEAEKNGLMDPIKSTSESKFNDTPQDVQGTFDWGSDDHLTNISKGSVAVDGNTKIARINEIQNLLDDFYKKWSREFGRLFLY